MHSSGWRDVRRHVEADVNGLSSRGDRGRELSEQTTRTKREDIRRQHAHVRCIATLDATYGGHGGRGEEGRVGGGEVRIEGS